WLGIRPGTDGLFILSLIHELLQADRIDLDYLVRYTNAPWLVIQAAGSAEDGLFARNSDGRPLVFAGKRGALVDALEPGTTPRLIGHATLPDGRRAVPAFELMARRYLDPIYSPDAVAPRTGIPAETIRRIAGELARVALEEPVVLEQPWTDW